MTNHHHTEGTTTMLDNDEIKTIAEALADLAYDYSAMGDRVGPRELATRLVQAWCVTQTFDTYYAMLPLALSRVEWRDDDLLV